MAQKKKAKSSVEYLRYPGLGFDPRESSSTLSAQGQARGIQFVPPTARAGMVASERGSQGSATRIDAPLSPRTREVKGELCLETSPPAPPREEESQIPSQEAEIAGEDLHAYVLQEVQIPLGEDGLPGPWCSFHQSDGHNVDDCRKLKKRPRSGECYTCGELGHHSRDCRLNPKPRRAPKKKSPRTVIDASTQTDNLSEPRSPPIAQGTQDNQLMTATGWDQDFFYEGQPRKEWDLPGHIVTIHPGPSGPPRSTGL